MHQILFSLSFCLSSQEAIIRKFKGLEMTKNLSEHVVNLENNTHTSYSSHCWEPDGSFHAVCIFVISISIVCGIITIFSVYRIAQMVAAAMRLVKPYQCSSITVEKGAREHSLHLKDVQATDGARIQHHSFNGINTTKT